MIRETRAWQRRGMLSSLPWCFRTKSSIVLQDARDKALLCGMATWIPPLTSLAYSTRPLDTTIDRLENTIGSPTFCLRSCPSPFSVARCTLGSFQKHFMGSTIPDQRIWLDLFAERPQFLQASYSSSLRSWSIQVVASRLHQRNA